MASIFRRTYTRPIPPGAEIVTRKGERRARWKDKRGRTKTAPLSEDGREIVLEYRSWYSCYEGANGRRITVKGFPDCEATEQLAKNKEALAARIKTHHTTVDLDQVGKPLSQALDAWVADLTRQGRSEM